MNALPNQQASHMQRQVEKHVLGRDCTAPNFPPKRKKDSARYFTAHEWSKSRSFCYKAYMVGGSILLENDIMTLKKSLWW